MMGLLDKAAEAADRDKEIRAARHTAWVLECEKRDLDAARRWWNEHIGEPAEFWLGHRWSACNLSNEQNEPLLRHIIVTCDGWAFEVEDYKHMHYSKQVRCAFLIYDTQSLPGWPRHFEGDNGKITDMASLGRVLTRAMSNEAVAARLEGLVQSGYGQLMLEGRYE